MKPIFVSKPLYYKEQLWPAVWFLIWLLAFLNIILWWKVEYGTYTRLTPLSFMGNEVDKRPEVFVWTKSMVAGYVAQQAVIQGLDPIKVLTIAFKESSYNPNARNPKSSAKGLFMFIDKTWANYCKGDVFDPIANTECFMKLYPKYPNWWKQTNR